MRFMSPTNDHAFKHIFGSEKNLNVLINFLNATLEFTKNQQIRNLSSLL